jgi:hypothetical protein
MLRVTLLSVTYGVSLTECHLRSVTYGVSLTECHLRSVTYAEYHLRSVTYGVSLLSPYAEYHHTECRYAECRSTTGHTVITISLHSLNLSITE